MFLFTYTGKSRKSVKPFSHQLKCTRDKNKRIDSWCSVSFGLLRRKNEFDQFGFGHIQKQNILSNFCSTRLHLHRHRQRRVDVESVAGVLRVPGAEGRKDEVLLQVVSCVGGDPLERHQQEADGPVKDLNERDDRNAGEEAEGAADGRDHVEDACPELQGDAGDDGGVVVEVEDGDVAAESLVGQLQIWKCKFIFNSSFHDCSDCQSNQVFKIISKD